MKEKALKQAKQIRDELAQIERIGMVFFKREMMFT